jgi:hypothetical protein
VTPALLNFEPHASALYAFPRQALVQTLKARMSQQLLAGKRPVFHVSHKRGFHPSRLWFALSQAAVTESAVALLAS